MSGFGSLLGMSVGGRMSAFGGKADTLFLHREMSAYDWTFPVAPHMSAFGGNADMARAMRNVCF
jgi:hypothetical protein